MAVFLSSKITPDLYFCVKLMPWVRRGDTITLIGLLRCARTMSSEHWGSVPELVHAGKLTGLNSFYGHSDGKRLKVTLMEEAKNRKRE